MDPHHSDGDRRVQPQFGRGGMIGYKEQMSRAAGDMMEWSLHLVIKIVRMLSQPALLLTFGDVLIGN